MSNQAKAMTQLLEAWSADQTEQLLQELAQTNFEYKRIHQENKEILAELTKVLHSNPELAAIISKLDDNAGRAQAIECEYIYEHGLKDGVTLIFLLKN
jgi:hypothetical protein